MSTSAIPESTAAVQESTPPIQHPTPPPDLAKTEPAPSKAKMASKRKRAASVTSNSSTAPRRIQKKTATTADADAVPLSLTDPTKAYGIFQHRSTLDTLGLSADLIYCAPTFTTAHTHLLAYASSLISDNADWGACSTRTSDNKFEIHDYDGDIRAKFDIDTVRVTADGEWVREEIWLARHWAERPGEHYGMFVGIDPDNSLRSGRGEHYVGGYKSLGEASAAMKVSASSYLAANPGSRLFERSVEVVDGEGKVVQRYLIAKGREIGGQFVCEEEWVRKEKAVRDGDEQAIAAIEDGEVKKKGIMRLPTPPPLMGEEDAEGEVDDEALNTPAATIQEEVQQDQHAPVQASETQQPAFQPSQAQEVQVDDGVERWCICHQPDTGDLMIGCDNDDCPVQWYHGSCIGLDTAPAGDWLCETCAPAEAPATVKGKGKGKAKGKGGKKKVAAKAPKGQGGKGRKK